MFKFDRQYFQITLVLLTVEIFIAIFIKDRFIRPFVGDVLVVILLYCAIKSLLRIAAVKVAATVLVLSFTVEILQSFHLVDRLGLRGNQIVAIAIGSTFDGMDLVAYTTGIAIVLVLEHRRQVS